MTDCPFIHSTADRLLQQDRPSPPVCSGPENRNGSAKPTFPGLKPGQSLEQNLGPAAFTSNTIASVADTIPADNALSP